MTGIPNEAVVKRQIAAARGSTSALRAVFEDLVARAGHKEASRVWWAEFGANDASET